MQKFFMLTDMLVDRLRTRGYLSAATPMSVAPCTSDMAIKHITGLASAISIFPWMSIQDSHPIANKRTQYFAEILTKF